MSALAIAQGPPAPYAYNLTWTVSVTTGTTGQKVYRAPWTLPSGPCGTFATVTASSLSATATSYADSSVVPGGAYCYFVTAIGPTGESGPSNQVNGVLVPPQPPTNLAGSVS